MLLAQTSLTSAATGPGVVLASLSLVFLAMGLAWWLGLRIERRLIEASVRAAVIQLFAGSPVVSVGHRSSVGLETTSTHMANPPKGGPVFVRPPTPEPQHRSMIGADQFVGHDRMDLTVATDPRGVAGDASIAPYLVSRPGTG